MNNILEVKNLEISYISEGKNTNAVKSVSFVLEKGETLGIIGESGSGKTSLAMAIMGLINSPSNVSGKILYQGVDLQSLTEKEKNKYRWDKISIVFQNNLEVLNPVLTLYEQIIEGIKRHSDLEDTAMKNKVIDLMKLVDLDPKWAHHYPHQLSGGMRQKVLIAMALACDPDLLIVDEPTTSLDPISANGILQLLINIQNTRTFSMIIISHELSILSKLSDRLLVMYDGHILEEGITSEIIKEPYHTYTRGLINSSIEIFPFHDLWGIPAEDSNLIKNGDGCPFYYRCNQRITDCKIIKPNILNLSDNRKIACIRGGIVTLLEGINISKSYIMHNKPLKACINCNIKVRSGEIVVLMGQSGSGKTTLASILSGILESDEGDIYFEGTKLLKNSETSKLNGIQMVFQDPFSATDSYMTVEEVIKQPLDIIKEGNSLFRKDKVKEALGFVQLESSE
ncbi:MAG: oligopeptide/dipeptide ABC transporter ATP-binding protein, partial [Vulcanibacillus sp.]